MRSGRKADRSLAGRFLYRASQSSRPCTHKLTLVILVDGWIGNRRNLILGKTAIHRRYRRCRTLVPHHVDWLCRCHQMHFICHYRSRKQYRAWYTCSFELKMDLVGGKSFSFNSLMLNLLLYCWVGLLCFA